MIDCCAQPTIIIAPSLSQSSFEYTIGDNALEISLSAPNYLGDNSCCVIPPQTPTITPFNPATVPPEGLFDVQSDIITTIVFWNDLSLVDLVDL